MSLNQVAMFGRESLLKTLDSECFGDHGSSTVIIGGHKVGKSLFLDHVYARRGAGLGLFCLVNLDSLRAFSGGNPLSNNIFLRFFLVNLREQITEWLRNQANLKIRWTTDLARAQQKLEVLAGLPEDPAISKHRQDQAYVVSALRQQLSQIQSETNPMNAVVDSIQKLEERSEPLQVHEIGSILTELRSLNKRITLIIDDYDQMVKEPGFTDNLFSFLRGMNNEHKIVSLVSSRTRLMDLFSDDDPEDRRGRKSLLNHFLAQRLVPFNRNEADLFLDWIAGDGNILGAEEKDYIRGLAGGCPHLLRYGRNLYLNNGRPKEMPERRAFEKVHLFDEFLQVFEQIWSSCSRDEQSILRRIADGDPVQVGTADRLEAEGYLVNGDSGFTVFSTLFGDFIRKKPKRSAPRSKSSTPNLIVARSTTATAGPNVEIDVSVDIPYEVFPSALFFGCPERADLATFKLDNRSGAEKTVQISCRFVPHSYESKSTFSLPVGAHEYKLQVELKKDEVRSLRDPVWTRVEYGITLSPGRDEQVLREHFKRVRLLPPDNFLFARYDPIQGILVDFTWLITAWVNSREPQLQEIRQRAAGIQPAIGHPTPIGTDPRQNGLLQVSAIYDALQEEKLKYHDAPLVFHSDKNDYLQRVQTCAETLRSKAANCLDGAVLFASLLSMSGLHPAILLIPGHALVGWKEREKTSKEWDFLETTIYSDFARARAVGNDKYQAVRHLSLLDRSAGIGDTKQFAILIDVHQTVTDQKIVPI